MNKRFKIYRSSAGSGKTYTLTKEYLKLALATPASAHFSATYFKHILAITFTNDAAAEMKHRIVKQLKAFASGTAGEDMLQQLVAEIAEEYDLKLSVPELRRRSEAILIEILHQYNLFSVSTIDSFTNRIVQSFRRELSISFSAELVLEKSTLVKEATEKLLMRVSKKGDKALTDTLVDFVLHKTDSGSWNIAGTLENLASSLFDEEKHRIADLMHDTQASHQLHQQLKTVVKDIETQARQLASAALQAVNADGQAAAFKAYPLKHLQKVAAGDTAEFLDTPNKNYYREDLFKKGAKISEGQAAAIRDAVGQLVAYAESQADVYEILRRLNESVYGMSVIKELLSLLEQLKKEHNIVHLSDYNRHINQVVNDSPVPFIYERIGEWYHHILIDEFQDTSGMQWQNLLPLLLHTLQKDMVSLIVGDVKQSIYAWRGAKPDILKQLPAVTEGNASVRQEAEVLFGYQMSPQVLDSNYRSLANIVHFNNAFFAYLKGLEAMQEASDVAAFYEDVVQQPKGKEGGYVELCLFDTAPKPELQAHILALLTEKLQQVFAQGYAPQDVAILIRRNSEAELVSQHLLSLGISVLSNESLALAKSAVVNFIVDFIGFLVQPQDATRNFGLLYFLKQHWGLAIGDLSLAAFAHNHTEGYRMADFFAQYGQKTLPLGQMQKMSLYELAEEIVVQFGLQRYEEELIFIETLLNDIFTFGLRHNTLTAYLDHWETEKGHKYVSSKAVKNAVRVITIHKSKGLEFPVVFVPFGNWRVNQREDLWIDLQAQTQLPHPVLGQFKGVVVGKSKSLGKVAGFREAYRHKTKSDILENLNVLYVALTRAAEALFVFSAQSARREALAIGTLFASFADSLAAGNSGLPQVMPHRPEPPHATHQRYLVFDTWRRLPHAEANEGQHVATSSLHPIHALNRKSPKVKSLQANQEVTIEDLQQSQQRGLLIHKVLERIRFDTDIDSAIESLVAEGLILPEQRPGYQTQMEQLVRQPEVQPFFSQAAVKQVYTERELLSNEKGKTLRPDRLVVMPDGLVSIIDYKSGEEKAEHRTQLQAYERIVRSMGYNRVNKYLIYTKKGKVLKVD